MPVEKIGTDAVDLLTITASELEGSTIDGGGGEDILELASGDFYLRYDFRSVAVFSGIERIRGISSSHSVSFLSNQIQGIKSFENPNHATFDLNIEGENVDFRNKALDDNIDVYIQSNDATFTVDDMQVAMSVNGTCATGEMLVVEGLSLTDAQRRALHGLGIDRVKDATGIVTEDLFVPSISGLDNRVAVAPGARLHPAAYVSLSEDIGLESMVIQIEDFYWGTGTLSINQSGSVRITSGEGLPLVSIEGRVVAEVLISDFYLGFYFNAEATVADAQEILKALVYESRGTAMPARSSKLKIELTDLSQKSTEAQIELDYRNDAPTDISLNATSIILSPGYNWSTFLSATDPNDGERFTFTLLDDANGQFILKSYGFGVLLSQARPLDNKQTFTITIRATDHGGLSVDRTFTLPVIEEQGSSPDPVVDDPIIGTDDDDDFVGFDGDEEIMGFAGDDVLRGEGGNDTLYGGLGQDMLIGGEGADKFVFNTKVASKRNQNIDIITDFAAREDTIWLENAIFTKLGKTGGLLKKSHFYKGKKAHDKNDYIVYDSKKGALYYDKDGSGASKAVQIAILKNKPAITYKDFLVI